MIEEQQNLEHTQATDLDLEYMLEQVFIKEEETIEELVNSFTCFKENRNSLRESELSQLNGHCNGASVNGLTPTSHRVGISQGTFEDDGELVEENIGVGYTLPPVLFRPKETSSGIRTKFDNFVDAELSDFSTESDNDESSVTDPENAIKIQPAEQDFINAKVEEDLELQNQWVSDDVDYNSMPQLYSISNVFSVKSQSTNIQDSRELGTFQVDFINHVTDECPLPGEIQREATNAVTTKANFEDNASAKQYIISSLEQGPTQNDDKDLSEEPTETLVEEFKLDMNVDYDNVQCTPKFNLSFLKERQYQDDGSSKGS